MVCLPHYSHRSMMYVSNVPHCTCSYLLALELTRSLTHRSGNTLNLTLSQTTNFRRFQTERVCRRQFQI